MVVIRWTARDRLGFGYTNPIRFYTDTLNYQESMVLHSMKMRECVHVISQNSMIRAFQQGVIKSNLSSLLPAKNLHRLSFYGCSAFIARNTYTHTQSLNLA